MSKLVDKERLEQLAKALDGRAKAAVSAEAERAQGAEAALDTKIGANTKAIATINNAETGLLKQAKTYTDGKILEVNGANEELSQKIASLEEVNGEQSTLISGNTKAIEAEVARATAAEKANTSAIEAEVTRAKAAEKANADAISEETTNRTAAVSAVQGDLNAEISRAKAAEQANASAIGILNGTTEVAGSVAKKIADAISPINASIESAEGRLDVIESKNTEQDNAITTGDAATLSAAKSYTDTKITQLVNGAPEAMNTLKELANAITEHQGVYDAYVAQVSSELSKKVDKVEGSRLITEAEVNEFKAKANVGDVTKALNDAKAYTDEKVSEINSINSSLAGKVSKLETTVGKAATETTAATGILKDIVDLKAKNITQDNAISAAQAQADKGVDDAATAKSAADAADAKARNAQTAADTADAKAVQAQSEVDALELIVGDSTKGLVKQANDNKAAIAAINNAETGLLKQAKTYTDGKIGEVNSAIATERGRIDAVESKNTEQDTTISGNTRAIEAEVTRAKAAEKANADAIGILNGTGAGSVSKSISDALVTYSNTAEVKNILSSVVGSLNLSIVEDKVKLTLGGVQGVTVSETSLNLATSEDIEAIIAGLDA